MRTKCVACPSSWSRVARKKLGQKCISFRIRTRPRLTTGTSCLLAELGRIAVRVSLADDVLIFLTPCTSSRENCAKGGPFKAARSYETNYRATSAGMRLCVCGRNVHFEEPRTSSRKTSLLKRRRIRNVQSSSKIRCESINLIKNIPLDSRRISIYVSVFSNIYRSVFHVRISAPTHFDFYSHAKFYGAASFR